MNINMGQTDRIVRLVVAAVLVLLAVFGVLTGWVAWVAVAVAIVFAATSAIKVCPLYMPFGIKTFKE